MAIFYVNNIPWQIKTVPALHPSLIDKHNNLVLATTDPVLKTVYISIGLPINILNKVLTHEMVHVYLISYNLQDYIYSNTLPNHESDFEEWICNFVSDYGESIFAKTNYLLGDVND